MYDICMINNTIYQGIVLLKSLHTKRYKFLTILISGFVVGLLLSAQEKADTSNKLIQADTAQQDTTEYEIVVLSPGYETFLMKQPPMGHYSKKYYIRLATYN